MKKNKQLWFTSILYSIFLISTVFLFIAAYNNMDLPFAFFLGYVFLLIFMLLYVPVVTIMNMRKIKWQVVRKSLIKFFTLFILSSAMIYGFDYLFRPESLDIITILSVCFGVSFGVAFIDLAFFNGNSKS
ncbi:hypothetical protein [Marinilactibacillus kalidii]|uniref:hypothetical protein n=1 Tax=Marinilactibacillus kalidii TaxID=2820274 RepID=UPI001ABE22FA|nr:hypothetical protein [Marinilactibacillus kalidii]